jgi:hypothetical protein
MNLRQKLCDPFGGLKTETADQLEKIADEHAIAFTNWCEDYYYPSSSKGIWFDKPDFDSANRYTTGELLKIYKQKKGL